MCLWVEQWVNCAKQLNHWDTLGEYARGTDNHALYMDCLWRLNDWDTLRNFIAHNKQSVSTQTCARLPCSNAPHNAPHMLFGMHLVGALAARLCESLHPVLLIDSEGVFEGAWRFRCHLHYNACRVAVPGISYCGS